ESAAEFSPTDIAPFLSSDAFPTDAPEDDGAPAFDEDEAEADVFSSETAGPSLNWGSLGVPPAEPGGDGAAAPSQPDPYEPTAAARPAQPPQAEQPPQADQDAPATSAAIGGDDLTKLSAVDAQMQARLYAIGVLTLDEIAQWTRADARRVAGQVGTSEEVILEQWVFEAQALLFERYQQALGNTTRRTSGSGPQRTVAA
ncbi:MAG: hypothetical protein R3362_08595, partial [Rhodothermales bacterium]|nr:hypothetical protein [Rhodothermales bacterium]